MRVTGVAVTALIVVFWVGMNSLLVLRQHRFRTQDRHRQAVNAYLGDELLRERWLGIYRDNKKVGYSGYVFEKVFVEEGTEVHSRLESVVEVDFLFGIPVRVDLQGSLVLDGELRPLRLRLEVVIANMLSTIFTGEAEGERFLVEASQGGAEPIRVSLPRDELFLGDAIGPSLPVSGLAVGDEFEVPYFNPLSSILDTAPSVCSVRVVSRSEQEVEGLLADVFELETEFGNMRSRSWVTSTGEVLRQEFGPPLEGLVLRRERKENARRFFKK